MDRYGTYFFSLVLMASLALNVFLGIRVRDGKAPTIVRTAGFNEGTLFPALSGKAPDGTDRNIAITRPTIIYVFSPQCSWCERDYGNLNAVAAAVAGRYDFVAVTQNAKSLREHLMTRPMPGLVVSVQRKGMPAEIATALAVTPQLLVLREDASIERAWVGALMDSRKREVEDFFNIQLPGVTARAQRPSSAGATQ